ncbi:MAG: sensor histidine kinase [Sphingomonadaceae bacterium]
MASLPSFRRAYPDFAIAAKSAIGFWGLYFALVTTRSYVMDHPYQLELMSRRIIVTAIGIGICFIIYLALQRLRDSSLRRQILAALSVAVPFAIVLAAIHFYIFNVYHPPDPWWQEMDRDAQIYKATNHIVDLSINWLFFLIAWTGLYLSVGYAARTVEAERNVSRYRDEAQAAQLRALRYQVNPHFLFNTLNSLSSLIMSGRKEEAERMTMNLSTFFRSTLAVDPSDDLPLAEEIALQRLYLEIERVRFPERLRTEISIPDSLESVMIPALLLQPLVENAIKYGVARARRTVTVSIRAYEEAGSLHIKVSDDGGPAELDFPPRDDNGTGVGLRNVSERLRARFGEDSGVFAGPNPQGGFTVHLIMPVVRE